MTLAQGQMLQNRYRIAKMLAQGGMGAVYRAWDITLNRSCAVKENLDAPTDLEQAIFEQAVRLLERCLELVEGKAWDQRRKVRLTGVGVSKFESEERQLSLFKRTGEGKEEKLRRLSQAVDRSREKV